MTFGTARPSQARFLTARRAEIVRTERGCATRRRAELDKKAEPPRSLQGDIAAAPMGGRLRPPFYLLSFTVVFGLALPCFDVT